MFIWFVPAQFSSPDRQAPRKQVEKNALVLADFMILLWDYVTTEADDNESNGFR